MERRIVSDSKLCVRADEVSGRLIEGYGAVFDKPSKLISEDGKVFIEHINRKAFDKVLASSNLNVIMNRDHSDKKMLARTRSGTLSLSVDDYGLKYSFLSPKTALGDETLELVGRGDLDESSFRYSVKPSNIRWWREDGVLHREIIEVSKLSDCAIVSEGAFAGTDISIESDRSYIEFIEKENIEKEKIRSQELEEYYNKLNNNFYGVE